MASVRQIQFFEYLRQLVAQNSLDQAWHQFNDLRESYEQRMVPVVVQHFYQEQQELIRAFKSINLSKLRSYSIPLDAQDELTFTIQQIQDRGKGKFVGKVQGVMQSTGKAFTNATMIKMELGGVIPTPRKVLDYITNRVVPLADQINQTSLIKIRSVVMSGLREGRSVAEIENMIRGSYNGFIRSRPELISRTETGMLAQMTERATIEQTGVKDEVWKIWTTARDLSVRDSHKIEGQERQFDKRFSNGLLHPLEVGAPAKEVINCRCALKHERRSKSGKTMVDAPKQVQTPGSFRDRMAPQLERLNRFRRDGFYGLYTGNPDEIRREITAVGREIRKEIKSRLKAANAEVDKKIKALKAKIKKIGEEANLIEREFKQAHNAWVDAPPGEESMKMAIKRNDLWVKLQKADVRASELRQPLYKEIELLLADKRKLADVHLEVLGELRAMGGVNPYRGKTVLKEFARNPEYARKFVTPGIELKNYEKTFGEATNWFPEEWLSKTRAEVADIHLAVGERGYFSDFGTSPHGYKIVEVVTSGTGKASQFNTAVHEIGHLMQAGNPHIRKLEDIFYRYRTNDKAEPLKWLGKPYKKKEKARFDKWGVAYQGKDYGKSHYELMSMASEAMMSPVADNAAVFGKDSEFYEYMLGIWGGM